MNKSEWKKLYHEYRSGNFEFRCYMERNNFPCGYDDMLYERHEGFTQEFVEKSHPALKAVLDQIDSDDTLAYREWLLYGLYPEIKQKRLIEILAWARDDRMTA